MANQYTILWFRQDLRLADNPALLDALVAGDVLPIYILDDENAADMSLGAASRWWLYHSLRSLNHSLGGRLQIFSGAAEKVIETLCQHHDILRIIWNRCYEPWRICRDKSIKANLKSKGIDVRTFNGSLLWEPWQVLKKDNTPYKVFTSYYKKACLGNTEPVEMPLPEPTIESLDSGFATLQISNLTVDDLKLLSPIRWDISLHSCWYIGEVGAHIAKLYFFENAASDYDKGRNYPSQQKTSRLSPHLHWGEISPRQLWHAAHLQGDDDNIERFKTELGWREFSYYQLYHFPTLMRDNLQQRFDFFPWRHNEKNLLLWQQGNTGYPIVDAGMRELWQTGFMHNRVRMIVASFLVKNLLIHWRYGADWFWDCLVDADLASNSASWQWVAGCGADAAPYFRIFNPVIQGEKFDKQGEYTRRYVPELAALPDKYLFKPWEAPEKLLAQSNIKLGVNYPEPIVDIAISRKVALKAYQQLT